MDAHYGSYHRTIRSSLNELDAKTSGESDSETLQHYEDCYWEKIDPLFPIVHHPTYMTVNAPPLLAAMVQALGAQVSARDGAKSHSLSWFAFASRQFALVGHSLILGQSFEC